jgi:hypothetical protein
MTEDGQDPSEVERILRELAERETGDDLPAPGDERLRSYREGRLDAGGSRELEALLARSAAGRRRLLELAGVDRTLPLRRARKAVLAGGAPRRRAFSWAMAAAAAILVATLSTFFLHTGGAPGRGAYEVAARGLAEVRSGDPVPSPAAGPVRAYAGTALRIAVRARQEETPSGASFALFRRGRGFLRRVPPAEVRVESERGSATFTGEAARVLATRVPGVYALYVVVSTAGEPPAEVPLATGGDPVAALQSAGHLVYPLTVRLLADEPPAKETTR